jgi:hypothetical protein
MSTPEATRGNRGWQGNVPPHVYAEMIEWHIRHSDKRIVAALIFITDIRSNNWQSFDTEPAHGALLARKDNMVPQAAPPHPSTPGQPTATVNVAAGANIRSGPGMNYAVIGAEPNGTVMPIVGRNGEWWQVNMPHILGWVSDIVVDAQNTASVPIIDAAAEPTEPAPSDCWERADNPNDPGGATMKGITLGTYTRWREALGLPAPSKDDLRNITDAEVRQIYHDWYWLASGANKLPFPLCLAHFNIAVNAGPERAKQFLAQSDGDFLKFMAAAMDWYTKIDGWKHFGAAWTRRNADVLREAA